jgi:branched-chain amino acid transport system permease protein
MTDTVRGVSSGSVVVSRSRPGLGGSVAVLLVVVLLLVYLPYLVFSSTTDTLVNVFILLTMSTMWNLLAGYAGLVSVGQQAYVGLGAFLVLALAQHGVGPFAAIPIATIGTAVIALPVSLLLLRLRGGYFAIATWVFADTCQLVISQFRSLGGGTGARLPGLSDLSHDLLGAYTYWAALAVALAAIAATYLTLRSRLGLLLTAIRDDEIGARSVGGRVTRAKRIVYLVAAAGCGAAGGVLIISQLGIESSAAFSVGFSAQMIFVTVIGGIGTIEGPIVGTVVYFVLQQTLARYGAWYLIAMGLVAIGVALWWPRGIWGAVSRHVRIQLFPVGYWVGGGRSRRRGGRGEQRVKDAD